MSERLIKMEDVQTSPASSKPTAEAYRFPCSLVQRTCWFLEQMSPGTPAYNIAVRFVLTGPLETALLEAAFCEIVQRHEVLRTRFVNDNGEPKQLVESEVSFSLPVIDLRDIPSEQRDEGAERLADEEAKTGFDVERGPLLRAKLLQTEDDRYMLLLTLHHIIADGWSVGIITDELGAIYEALATGRDSGLPALPIQYGDYACWQQEWMNSGELDQQLEELRAKMDGLQPLDIPTDFPRPLTSTALGQIRSILLPRSITDSLQKISERRGCTLFVTMLSAFAVLLHLQSKQKEIGVRTQTAGRDRVELEPLIGWFVNSIVLRLAVSAASTFENLIESTNKTVLEMFEYHNVPFERLMETIRLGEALPRHPPFQANFIFQRDFVHPWRRAGIALIPIPSKATGTFVDLNFFLVEREDGWRASVDVNTDVFDPATGAYFLDCYRRVLQLVAEDPRVRLSDIMLPERTFAPKSAKEAVNCLVADYVPPRDEYERVVVDIWTKVLKTGPIGVFSNFFDLGGHSLKAVNLLSRFQQEFGKKVQLSQLFRDPTPAAMAALISGRVTGAGSEHSNATKPEDYCPFLYQPELRRQSADIIEIQPRGSRPPLFMLGGDHWFRPLAKRLGPEQPMVGLLLQKYESRSEPTPFEEIGADMSAQITKLQPAGPIFLSGWCVDATLAFEVAQNLLRAGREVGLVALLDAINPAYRREYLSTRAAAGRAFQRTLLLAREVARKEGRDVVAHAWNGLRELRERAARKLLNGDQIVQDPVIVQTDSERQEFRRLLYLSERHYSPRPISCPLLLLRTQVEFQKPNLGWDSVASAGLITIEIPGDHVGIFREPEVGTLAAVLSEHLNRQQNRYGAQGNGS